MTHSYYFTHSRSTSHSHSIVQEDQPGKMPDNLPDELDDNNLRDKLDDSDFPFVVEHLREGQGTGGTFRPAAHLRLTPALRTSGLWAALPAEEMRDLVLMLTFLTPNGRIHPTLPELAEAMNASQTKARARMLCLTRRPWQGQPLVRELTRPSGLDAYLPATSLLQARQGPQEATVTVPQALLEPRAGREALVAHSRARYAAPRAEVEADIARRMGWGPPAFEDDPPEVAGQKQRLYERLSEQGMTKAQAMDVLGRFDLDVVSRQLDWMPHRGAKNPARYLMAAIENNYEAPVAVRQANLAAQANLAEQESSEEQASLTEQESLTEADAPASHLP